MMSVTNEQILAWMEENVAHRLDLLEAQVRKTNGSVSDLQAWRIAFDAVKTDRAARGVVVFRRLTLVVAVVSAVGAFVAGHYAP